MRWFEKNIIAPLDRNIERVEKFWYAGAVQKIVVLFGMFLFLVISVEVVGKILG